MVALRLPRYLDARQMEQVRRYLLLEESAGGKRSCAIVSEFLIFAAWAFLGVIAVTATTFLAHSREQWMWLIAVWTLLGTVAFAWIYGVGHYWSVASYVGKLAATGLAICSTVTAASVGVMAGRSSGGTIWQIASGLIGGALGVFLGVYVGVFAACALTGDCP